MHSLSARLGMAAVLVLAVALSPDRSALPALDIASRTSPVFVSAAQRAFATKRGVPKFMKQKGMVKNSAGRYVYKDQMNKAELSVRKMRRQAKKRDPKQAKRMLEKKLSKMSPEKQQKYLARKEAEAKMSPTDLAEYKKQRRQKKAEKAALKATMSPTELAEYKQRRRQEKAAPMAAGGAATGITGGNAGIPPSENAGGTDGLANMDTGAGSQVTSEPTTLEGAQASGSEAGPSEEVPPEGAPDGDNSGGEQSSEA